MEGAVQERGLYLSISEQITSRHHSLQSLSTPIVQLDQPYAPTSTVKMKGQPGASPRKRRRTQKQPARAKRGRLADFMNLPTDIFTLIASYLLPVDILSLAQANKFFRGLLMSKSSRKIWLDAMKNIKGLPACPMEMSEPEYVALLFTNVCSMCGALSRSPVDEFLLLRLCGTCKRDKLMKLRELPQELHDLVHCSAEGWGVEVPEMRKYLGVVARGDANLIWNQYKKLAEQEDKTAWKEWVAHRKRCTAARHEWAGELTGFLNELDGQRADEKRELLETRRRQIEERLLEAGWEAADLRFKPWSDGIQQWHELVEMPKQPRPLTDRVWKNLYAKLKPLLETNREERLEREYSKRKIHRRACLNTFLYKLKHKEPPLLKVKQRQSNSVTLPSIFQSVTQRDVFPGAHDALALPCVQEMNEEDLTVEEFREGLEKHRSTIEEFVTEWQDKTRAYLADLIREEGVEHSVLLQPPKSMDPDAFARLTDDQKLLLRADTLFYVGEARSGTVKQPYNYDWALQMTYPSFPEYQPWEPKTDYEPEVTDLGTIHRYAMAQEVARELLADLGKPDASFIEVNQLHYSCQRCHHTTPEDWTSILEHYLKHKQIRAKVEKHASFLAQEGIVYNHVDDISFSTRPRIKPAKPSHMLDSKVKVRKCALCARAPLDLNVTLSIPRLNKHLLEVHEVTEPKPDVHYRLPPGRHPMFGSSVGFGYDIEEPEEDNEQVEADNSPEEEATMDYYELEGTEDGDSEEGSQSDSE
ncbi:unnamed protein product [Rhizoctonia solani]|uniref:F-box domain-containing protein n=1 Tax=Rhizoctonia solani TaxID=456999 RepID=A0A8H3HW53_9AGAM|nr:unnamed protein product [Rhizoctonia solani]